MKQPPSQRKLRLSIVTPCYNEEDVVGPFVAALTRVLLTITDCDYRIYMIDDGSRDATFARLLTIVDSDPHVYALSLSRNFGHQAALTAGLDVARGDAIIMMDSDLQHPPELLPEMVAAWRAGNEVVSAVRRRTADASLLKRITSNGFYTVLNLLSDTYVKPGAADYCLLSAKAAKALRRMPERHRFLRGMVAWMGFQRAYIEFEAPPRFAGHSKYTLTKMLRLALDATFSFSVTPLRSALRLGIVVVVLGVMYLTWALFAYFAWGGIQSGWSSLMAGIVLLGGMQLLLVGLLGEYVGRVYEESKRRPLYVIGAKAHRRANTTSPNEIA